MEACGSEVPGYPLLHSGLETSLGHMWPYLKTEINKQTPKNKKPQQNLNKSSLDKRFAQNYSEELKRQVSPRGVSVRDRQRPSFKTCHVIREEIPQWKEEGERTHRDGGIQTMRPYEDGKQCLECGSRMTRNHASKSGPKPEESRTSNLRGKRALLTFYPQTSSFHKYHRPCLCLKPAPGVLLQSLI